MVLLAELAEELTSTFGGCTILPRTDGLYQASTGMHIIDLINIIFTDTHKLKLDKENFSKVEKYVDYITKSINAELQEEAILISVCKIHNTLEPID